MCGSRPLPEAVTRSTGTGSVLAGSARCSAARCMLTASIWAGLVGPRFEPVDETPLEGCGVVADGRDQKYFGLSNGCPSSADPTRRSPCRINEPSAARAQHNVAMPVTTNG